MADGWALRQADCKLLHKLNNPFWGIGFETVVSPWKRDIIPRVRLKRGPHVPTAYKGFSGLTNL